MHNFESFERNVYPANERDFEKNALDLFQFQASENAVYREYLTYMGVAAGSVTSLSKIPFLPITLFRTHPVITGHWTPEISFVSSGTSGQLVSRHPIRSLNGYLEHSTKIFESFYGALDQFHVLCLLPSYLERTGSSLVAMASHFITKSGSPESGFYLNDMERLLGQIEKMGQDRKILLLGVSFALLDLAEQFEADLSRCIVMETGGMKGRRPEITRQELHGILKENLHVESVHSEYGMTELLSQAYSSGDGMFHCPPSMKVLLRELNDPFGEERGAAGVINVIDLANVHTCAFIETQDLGRVDHMGHFEVLGRMDNSEIRGCNLLVN